MEEGGKIGGEEKTDGEGDTKLLRIIAPGQEDNGKWCQQDVPRYLARILTGLLCAHCHIMYAGKNSSPTCSCFEIFLTPLETRKLVELYCSVHDLTAIQLLLGADVGSFDDVTFSLRLLTLN